MSKREDAKKRMELLKQLREKYQVTVAQTQDFYKAQRKIQKSIHDLIKDEGKTIPEIAEAVHLPAHEVLWHVTTLKKYENVVEDGMSGEYFLYRQREEKVQ
jgi:predicted transcriptional regulator